MRMTPEVSVIITAFNSMPHLQEALASLNGQPYRPLEIVLVDDENTDSTPKYVRWARRWLVPEDVEFRFLHYPTNHGVAYARNRGLVAAPGVSCQADR